MHSYRKLKELYPQMSLRALKEFYGHSVIRQISFTHQHGTNFTAFKQKFDPKSLMSSSRINVTELNQIDLAEFMINTLPNYLMVHCVLEFLDCRFLWEKVFSMNGLCYRFDVQKAIERHNELHLSTANGGKLSKYEKKQMETIQKLMTLKYWKNFSFVIGLNKSDNTYGWNVAQSPLYMRISHYQNRYEFADIIPLSKTLIPTILIRTVKTEFHASPYTDCVQDLPEYHCANYSEPVGQSFANVSDKCYDESVCKMKIAVKTILEECECAPTYLGSHKNKSWLEYLQSEEALEGPDQPVFRTNVSRSCNFLDHSTCIAFLMQNPEAHISPSSEKMHTCKPNCQTRIHDQHPPKLLDGPLRARIPRLPISLGKVFSMNGLCYRFDVQKAIERHNELHLSTANGGKLSKYEKKQMETIQKLMTLKYWKNFSFVIGLNKSDNTYGWNVAQSPLYMRISHYQNRYEFADIIPLSKTLIPTILIRTVKTEFHASPYTDCVQDLPEYHCANYSEPVGQSFANVSDKCYDESVCKMKIAVKTILEECECAPTYLGSHKNKSWLEYLQSEEALEGPDQPVFRTNVSRSCNFWITQPASLF
ncbi:Oidioi.mRNA.OKI2018_I69.PAR.g9417.t1.cds [Oikopleura dioica]|uniref:Oidioi.mRNA.OKI2018_I69.PAR.g9417.t1.cds n=1 Tax=Oikopleura dioica TaxID=34765 RepID=A0ABN7RKK0_OIKDI|nr:Oidioi.mRNA.OKI2018_I69.PAR.g9417.t1.cds [Oikopleura dioica]